MRTSVSRALILIVTAAFSVAAIPGHTQTAPAVSTTEPTPAAQPAKATQPAELQWTAAGATAQCTDGTFFHGKIDQRACSEHGGVKQWLRARDQVLLR